jgi:hypothetical protein
VGVEIEGRAITVSVTAPRFEDASIDGAMSVCLSHTIVATLKLGSTARRTRAITRTRRSDEETM